MRSVGIKLVSFMIVLACLWSCFGVGNIDFFAASNDVLIPLNDLAVSVSEGIEDIFGERESYQMDDIVTIRRYHYKNYDRSQWNVYIDVIHVSDAVFSKRSVIFATDSNIVGVTHWAYDSKSGFVVSVLSSLIPNILYFVTSSGEVVYRYNPVDSELWSVVEFKEIYYKDYVMKIQNNPYAWRDFPSNML